MSLRALGQWTLDAANFRYADSLSRVSNFCSAVRPRLVTTEKKESSLINLFHDPPLSKASLGKYGMTRLIGREIIRLSILFEQFDDETKLKDRKFLHSERREVFISSTYTTT